MDAKQRAEWLQAGRSAWPQVKVADDRFLAFLEARAEGKPESLQVADAYLACGCLEGDPAALAAFDDVYLGRLGRALGRSNAPEVVTEVLQRLRVQLLVGPSPGLLTYQGRSELHTWLRIVAMREAARVVKVPRREVEFPDEEVLTELATADPELSYLKEVYRQEVAAALARAFRDLSSRERRLLRHHICDELNVDEIGALFQVHRATAARWVDKARERMCELVRLALTERLRLPDSELDEVLGLVRSRLDVSVRRLLRETHP